MNTMDSGEYTWVKYNPLKSLFTKVDWFLFGSPIEQLCKNMPLYEGEVVTKPSEYQGGQTSSGSWCTPRSRGQVGEQLCEIHLSENKT